MNSISDYSPETLTAMELLESIPQAKRKYIVEQLRSLVVEEEIEEKWDRLLESYPEPMLRMAKQAIQQHKTGKSKPMTL